jgi:hypothetical protein
MTQAFRSYTVVRGKEPQLRNMVAEVRYQDGQLYLDRCGRLLKELQKAPDWLIATGPTPQATSLWNHHTGTQLTFSMSATSLSLDKANTDEIIEPAEVEEFLQQISAGLVRVLDELEVTEFTRLGYRERYYFPCDTKEEAETWLNNLGLIGCPPGLPKAFGAAVTSVDGAVIMQAQECRYRVGLSVVERPAQIPVGDAVLSAQLSAVHKETKRSLLETMKRKRHRQIDPAFAAVLDVDAYLLEPVEFDVTAFVQEHSQNNLKRFREALPAEPDKKGN